MFWMPVALTSPTLGLITKNVSEITHGVNLHVKGNAVIVIPVLKVEKMKMRALKGNRQ